MQVTMLILLILELNLVYIELHIWVKMRRKDLLQNDIMKKCELVLLGLPPPTQCKSEDCRFGNPSSSGGLGDEDICCPDAWESPDIINVDLPEIGMEIAKELGLGTIPFREAIGECLRRNQNFTHRWTEPARDTG